MGRRQGHGPQEQPCGLSHHQTSHDPTNSSRSGGDAAPSGVVRGWQPPTHIPWHLAGVLTWAPTCSPSLGEAPSPWGTLGQPSPRPPVRPATACCLPLGHRWGGPVARAPLTPLHPGLSQRQRLHQMVKGPWTSTPPWSPSQAGGPPCSSGFCCGPSPYPAQWCHLWWLLAQQKLCLRGDRRDAGSCDTSGQERLQPQPGLGHIQALPFCP